MKIRRDGSSPLYRQIAQILRKKLAGLEPGARFYPELEIAAHYQVSRQTACQAVQQLVREGRLYRVQGKGTFVRGHPAARRKNILVVLPRGLGGVANPHAYICWELLQGVLDELRGKSNLILADIPPESDETRFILEQIGQPLVDGVVLLQYEGLDRIVAELTDRRIPYALLNVRSQRPDTFNTILADEADGVVQAVRYLVELGHRRIDFVRPRPTSVQPPLPVADRTLAYVRSMQALVPGRGPRMHVFDRDDPASVEELRRSLTGEDRPTAVVAASDAEACFLLDRAGEWGLLVPQQMSLVGFDDSPRAAETIPPLTTVLKPRHRMGEEAARLVLRLASQGFALVEMKVLPTVLVRRESCAPPPKADDPSLTTQTGREFA